MNQDPAAGDDAPKDANTQEKPAPGGKQPKPPMNQAQNDQPAGDKPDADQPRGEPSDGQANPSDGTPKSGDQPGQKAGEGKPQLNGNPETGGPPEQDPEMIKQDGSQEPGGEAANLEYKRKATDLALEHLKDQLAKDKPDQELLDKTGWTREDMQRFVDKWEAMKRDAKQPGARGEAARQELDQALRELKLKPRGTSLDAGQGKDDRTRRMRDARRSTPPPEYQDLYRTFTKERE